MLKGIGTQLDGLLIEDEELRETVSPEDMRILHQRVVLVKEMWTEVSHLLFLYRQRLNESLGAWDDFDSQYNEFRRWLSNMEAQLQDDEDKSLEAVVSKLEDVSIYFEKKNLQR